MRKKAKDKSSKRATVCEKANVADVEEVKRNSDPSRMQQPPDSARLAQMDTDVSQADMAQQPSGGDNYVRSTSYDEALNPFGDDDEGGDVEANTSHVYQAIDEARDGHK